MDLRVLLVEDSRDDAELILYSLRNGGFTLLHDRVFSESALREALADGHWDVALVDFSLPGFGGLEALHVLSEVAPDVPAITVSGAISDETAVATMAAGAVDYVLKDNLTRLAPAVERAVAGAELRRRERRAAEEARQSKFAVDHASQAIVYVSEDGIILYANEAAGRLAGVAPEAAIGRGIWGWYPRLSREDWSELWRRAVQGPVPDVESVLRRTDGEERTISMTLDHMERDEGAFVIAYARDTTELRAVADRASETEARYVRLADNLPDIVFRYDLSPSPRLTYINPAVEVITGYSPDECYADPQLMLTMIHPDDAPVMAAMVHSLNVPDEPMLMRWIGKDGVTRMMESRLVAVRDARGELRAIEGITRDVTESKRVETELRFARFVVEHAADPIFWMEAEGTFKYANPAAREALGYTLDELQAMSIRDIDPLFAASWPEHIRALKESGSLTFETRHRRRDGAFVPMEVTAAYLEYDGVAYDVGFARDITERKRAEQALAHSRDLLDYVVAHARSAIAIHDRDLNYIYVSQRYLDDYGITERDVIGKNHYDVFPDLPQKWRDAHQRALAGEVCGADRDPFPRADGTVEWTRWECRPWYETDGTIGGIIVYTEVITERVRAEEALRESERRFAAFATRLPGRLWIRDRDLRYLYVNPQLAADLGGVESDFLGKSPEELWDPRTAADARDMCRRAFAGEVVDVSERWPDRDGSGYYRSLVFSLAAGEGAGMLGGLMFDVTEQHAAQEEVGRQAEQLAHIVEEAVLAMSQIVESRDPYTAGHERRVSELAVAIGAEMHLSADALDGLRMAGLIHDVGKISVPAEILAKPGRLSAVEFNLIKQHSQAGHDILAPIEFRQPVAQIVLQHHERLDGSGYPHGRAGEDILPEGRILAVADVVEAMSSHRPYRPSLGLEPALAEIRDGAGVRYDADVAAACERVFAAGFEFAV